MRIYRLWNSLLQDVMDMKVLHGFSKRLKRLMKWELIDRPLLAQTLWTQQSVKRKITKFFALSEDSSVGICFMPQWGRRQRDYSATNSMVLQWTLIQWSTAVTTFLWLGRKKRRIPLHIIMVCCWLFFFNNGDLGISENYFLSPVVIWALAGKHIL